MHESMNIKSKELVFVMDIQRVYFEAGTVFSSSRQRSGDFTWPRIGAHSWAVVSTLIKPKIFLIQGIH